MSKYKEITKLKRKLTLVFTFIIFLVVLGLQSVFFGYKYLRDFRLEIGRLYEQSITLKHFINTPAKRLGSVGELGNLIDKMPVKGMRGLAHSNIVFVQDGSFTVQLVDNIEQEYLNQVFEDAFQGKLKLLKFDPRGRVFRINIDNQFYILTIDAGDNMIGDYRYMILNKLDIDLADFYKDFITFFVISLLFGILIYYLGSKFVAYNLKPVEEKMEEMESFIHNAGHELRTPIAVINSSLQLARDIKDYDEAIDDSLNEIKNMDSLITSLVTLSTLDKKEIIEDVDINGEIKKIIKSYDKKIKEKILKIDLIENFEAKVRADPSYFAILVSNLISNAIRYSNKGAKIIIIINKTSIQVSDNGIGIEEENLKHIFKRFYKENKARNKEGFGIGLALVKKIVNLYGWKISVDSEKGKGTTVLLKF